jgi:hypothetical protein
MSAFYEFFASGGMVRAGPGRGWRCLFANKLRCGPGRKGPAQSNRVFRCHDNAPPLPGTSPHRCPDQWHSPFAWRVRGARIDAIYSRRRIATYSESNGRRSIRALNRRMKRLTDQTDERPWQLQPSRCHLSQASGIRCNQLRWHRFP